MFQRFQILIKSEKNLSVFVYGKSRTNKVNNNYNNIVLFHPYNIPHISGWQWNTVLLTSPAKDALMLKVVLTYRHAVLDFGDHKNKWKKLFLIFEQFY